MSLVPAQGGSAEITGAEALSVLPQLSVTVGTVGATASAHKRQLMHLCRHRYGRRADGVSVNPG